MQKLTSAAGCRVTMSGRSFREVGAGIAHAHDRRVIHGDLKPQNVMVTNDGELRILDFGTSRESTPT